MEEYEFVRARSAKCILKLGFPSVPHVGIFLCFLAVKLGVPPSNKGNGNDDASKGECGDTSTGFPGSY